MLSRTAESLYWTARYIERAETNSRLLEVGYRMSMMPSQAGGYVNEWTSLLAAAGVAEPFAEYYTETNETNILNFLIFDERNPSSIKICIRSARENARAARTALTSEVWETINHTYIDFQKIEADRQNISLPEFCDWMKQQSSMLRGSFENTQLQGEGFDFFNLGYYVERADNTARLLDIKYYVLLPTIDMVGGGVDRFQWYTLLRAMSARRSFHWVYHGDYSPQKIAHFLILNVMCPRSLLHCVEKIDYHLTRLSRAYKKRTQANAFAGGLLGELAEYRIEDIVAGGLHEFLSEFIAKNAKMTDEIAKSYLFGHP